MMRIILRIRRLTQAVVVVAHAQAVAVVAQHMWHTDGEEKSEEKCEDTCERKVAKSNVGNLTLSLSRVLQPRVVTQNVLQPRDETVTKREGV